MDFAVFTSVFMIVFMILLYVPLIAMVVLQYVAGWKILRKMDRPGWWIFVPFAMLFIFYDRCWKRGAFWRMVAYYAIYMVGYFVYLFYIMFSAFTSIVSSVYYMDVSSAYYMDDTLIAALIFVVFALAMLIPIVVNQIRMYLHMATCFGKSKGFGWGLALLTPIFMMILGFGKDRYLGNPPVQPQYAPPASYLPPQNYPPQNYPPQG